MVDESIEDGHRIAELLASEVTGLDREPLHSLSVVDANPDVEPTEDGAFAYGIDVATTTGDDGDRLADVYVQAARAYVEFQQGVAAAREAAADADLRVRPKATTPPRLLVFVEQAAHVKRAADVLVAAVEGETGAATDGNESTHGE